MANVKTDLHQAINDEVQKNSGMNDYDYFFLIVDSGVAFVDFFLTGCNADVNHWTQSQIIAQKDFWQMFIEEWDLMIQSFYTSQSGSVYPYIQQWMQCNCDLIVRLDCLLIKWEEGHAVQ
ncbi:hypothetical protein [Persicobacter sp. CCB-QB2]|uniref:hypothetical protein n=1 Tax=Persicobacter sp. CCB-QB2 TaxID=1561025 RepID=UPI0006A98101|nr:hypothetical protein [Persicobacter sp. CCB-QB2]